MQTKQITKRQYYVQRIYIAAWANPKKVWVLDKANNYKQYNVDPANVLCENYYYEDKPLSAKELQFIISVLELENEELVCRTEINSPVDVLNGRKRFECLLVKRSHLLSILDSLLWTGRIIEWVNKQPDSFRETDECKQLLRVLEKQSFEYYLCKLEEEGFPVVNKLINGEYSLTDVEYESLMLYCAVSYTRTKDCGDKIQRTEKVRPFLQLGFGFEIAVGLISNNYKISVLKNTTQKRFITGSSPCINLLAVNPDWKDGFKLYFPLSVDKGLVICPGENGKRERDADIVEINDEKDVKQYNDDINYFSSILIAREKEDLAGYIVQ